MEGHCHGTKGVKNQAELNGNTVSLNEYFHNGTEYWRRSSSQSIFSRTKIDAMIANDIIHNT